MKVIAINGGPRKGWNTATLLDKALEGAASQGAETELVNLYDINFKGCTSCFACKVKGGKSYGKCGWKDGLTPVLEKIEEADALFVGSPIYFGMVTGETRSFLERLFFQYLVYDRERTILTKKKIPVGIFYTMNVREAVLEQVGYEQMFKTAVEMPMQRFFGQAETLYCTDTYQFEDYSRYETSGIDEAGKAKRRKEVFPEDCNKAYAMGKKFAGNRK